MPFGPHFYGDAVVKGQADLPGQLTSFVGREPTIARVVRRLQVDRLVTLVGPGGCGKTRLSVEVGRRVVDLRHDGVFFVDLSGLSDPRLVANSVLQVLGLRAAPGRDPIEILLARLPKRELLLILDNCEHLLDACASLANALTRGCPKLWTLATSRESFGIAGEVLVRIEGLELPDLAQPPGVDWLMRSEASMLFMDRADRACPGFVVDEDGAETVARICGHLDGIPLALELAAARTKLMSVEAIAEGLSDPFGLLVGSGRTGPPRHKSLRASIEWSCGLLMKEERAILWRLSVFASGFSRAAAEAVSIGVESEPENFLGLLSSLVDKCLVQADARADRFRLHETMRSYAGAALAAEGLTRTVRDHHLGYFSDLARAVHPLGATSGIAFVVATVEADLDNFRTALDWSVQSGQFDTGAKLLSALGTFFTTRGLWPEGLARSRVVLAAELAPVNRASVLFRAAHFARNSDPAASLRMATELIELGRSIGDDLALARGLYFTSNVQAWTEPDAAVKTADQALYILREGNLPGWLAALTQLNKAWAHFWLGRPEDALSIAEQGRRESQELDHLWGVVMARVITSILETYCGRPSKALQEAETVVRLTTELSSPTFVCFGERHRAEAYLYLGDRRAVDALDTAQALAESVDDIFNLASTEATAGLFQISTGCDDDGYTLVQSGVSKLEALGFARMCIRDRAVLAEVALRRGDFDTARCHLEASVWRLPRRADPEGVPILRVEARLARAQRSFQRAHGLACDGLQAAVGSGQRLWAIDLLELVALTAADLGHHAEAGRLLGAAETQRALTGYARWSPAQDELAPVLVGIESSLGREALDGALSEGRALTLQQAGDYACRGRGRHTRRVSGWDSLTPAERRVVSLVADGLSNAQIGDQLFVSTATVKSHLSRVFDKLEVANRGQLARQARAQLGDGRP
jgi:predicted ATPase/DNA-binding CsgD family transcriptional regulator